jgi:hypothetical protein
MIAVSRIPIGVVRSMPVRIWRISSTVRWAGQATWRGAVRAHQSPAYLANALGGDGVRGVGHAVDVSDRGAAHVEGAYGSAGFGTFGEVGAQGERVAGQRGNPSGVAPALPLVPHLGVDVTGRLGACCGDHCGDPLGVCLGESGRQACRGLGGQVAGTGRQGGGHERVSGRVVAATTEAPSPEVTLHCSPVRGDVRKSDSLMTDQVRYMARWSTLVDAADQAENSQARCHPSCDRGKVCRSARSTRRARGHSSTERVRRGHCCGPAGQQGQGVLRG